MTIYWLLCLFYKLLHLKYEVVHQTVETSKVEPLRPREKKKN